VSKVFPPDSKQEVARPAGHGLIRNGRERLKASNWSKDIDGDALQDDGIPYVLTGSVL
jgi:hypothetical protein